MTTVRFDPPRVGQPRRGPFGHELQSLELTPPSDVAAVVAGTRSVQPRWADTSATERSAMALRLHDVLLRRRSEILDTLQTEIGKSRGDAFEEVLDTALVCRHYARKGAGYLAPQRFRGLVPGLVGTRVERSPQGVVGVIAPWNYPLVLTLGEIVPALIAGNAVVVKPDPLAVDTCRLALSLLAEAGVPAGLVQPVIGGVDVGEALVDAIDYVVFTGSTNGGRAVAQRAAGRLIGCTLELGGKNALYVRADADLSLAVPGAVHGSFGNAGQLCLSAERVIVHRQAAEGFVPEFVRRSKAYRLGNRLDFSYDMGSLVSAAQHDKVLDHLADALGAGARVLAGGNSRPDVGPYCVEPTILENVPDTARCYREETFGPLVSVFVVDSDDEAVDLANDTDAGLTASVFTADEAAGRALARKLRVGSVTVNETYLGLWGSTALPFGGIGASGLGRRHGPDGVTSLTRPQAVVTQRGARVGFNLARLLDQPSSRWTAQLTGAVALLRRTGLS